MDQVDAPTLTAAAGPEREKSGAPARRTFDAGLVRFRGPAGRW
jgi:hypothetical protein